jgi:hypothetical protein
VDTVTENYRKFVTSAVSGRMADIALIDNMAVRKMRVAVEVISNLLGIMNLVYTAIPKLIPAVSNYEMALKAEVERVIVASSRDAAVANEYLRRYQQA